MKEQQKCIIRRISKNKHWEFQIGNWKHWSFFDFYIKLTRKQDHAGFYFGIEILGFYLYFDVHDNRHWNEETDNWFTEKDYEKILGGTNE